MEGAEGWDSERVEGDIGINYMEVDGFVLIRFYLGWINLLICQLVINWKAVYCFEIE